MKTYNLTLSQVFPSTHPRKGQQTGFKEKVLRAVCKTVDRYMSDIRPKIHTIRANYDFWRKRFEKIERGEACLSIRQWTGKPYRSKQIEIARLTRDDGIGIQKLEIVKEKFNKETIWLSYVDSKSMYTDDLAHNDGLSFRDWIDWFCHYDLSKPLAIIHFTKFRY